MLARSRDISSRRVKTTMIDSVFLRAQFSLNVCKTARSLPCRVQMANLSSSSLNSHFFLNARKTARRNCAQPPLSRADGALELQQLELVALDRHLDDPRRRVDMIDEARVEGDDVGRLHLRVGGQGARDDQRRVGGRFEELGTEPDRLHRFAVEGHVPVGQHRLLEHVVNDSREIAHGLPEDDALVHGVVVVEHPVAVELECTSELRQLDEARLLHDTILHANTFLGGSSGGAFLVAELDGLLDKRRDQTDVLHADETLALSDAGDR